MNNTEISHIGRIVDITPEETLVEIVSESACAGCHASALCGLGDAQKKIISVRTTPGNWETGQEVDVNLRRSMGFKAVWLAYVIPLAVLIAVLMALTMTGAAELTAGLSAIAAVAVYYLVLLLFKNKLSNEYTFYIKEKHN